MAIVVAVVVAELLVESTHADGFFYGNVSDFYGKVSDEDRKIVQRTSRWALEDSCGSGKIRGSGRRAEPGFRVKPPDPEGKGPQRASPSMTRRSARRIDSRPSRFLLASKRLDRSRPMVGFSHLNGGGGKRSGPLARRCAAPDSARAAERLQTASDSMPQMAVFRFMVVDEDGRRVGRYETSDPDWRAGDVFDLDEQAWRILEVLPEVSTTVAYNAVSVAAAALDDAIDDAETPLGGIHRGVTR